MTNLTGHNWIAGAPSRTGDRTFTSINPRTREAGEITFADATPAEIDRAVTAAAQAFEALRHASAHSLADFLERIADEIEALGDELLHMADWETALGIPRLTGERGRTTGQLRKFGALLREGSYVGAIIDTAQPDRQPAPRPHIRRMLFPIGPVGVFSASNFPFAFAVAGGDTASAFAAGCPVIVKGHPGHPATSELFARAIGRAVEASGFPPGTFSLLQGASINVGQALVQHPLLEAVGFTGSLRGGRALFDTAARRPRPIPVFAEMGSINPVFLLPGAVRAGGDALAEGIVASVTLGAGQFCTNPGLILVQDEPDTAVLIDGITTRMSARAPGVLLNEAIQRGLAQTVAGTLARPDVVQLTGGAIVACAPYCFDNTVLQTTAAAFIQDDALQTEHFGPVTLIVVCASADEMQAAARRLHGSLSASIHAGTDEGDAANALADILREKTGRLIWNGFPTGVEVVASMQHGGPYPATTAPATTSVGVTAIARFMRPVAFQNAPPSALPGALQDANPLGIWRTVNDVLSREPIG